MLCCFLDDNKGIKSLTSQIIKNTDRCCFSYSCVSEEGSFNFSGGETVAAKVDYVVDATADAV